jgi:hypothetical protein
MEQLVADFCAVPSRSSLYESVASGGRLVFEDSSSDRWGSQTVNGKTTIFHAPSNRPQACLGHELLHASLKGQGYKQYTVALCFTGKKSVIARVLSALDNELQHHKFYDLFLNLGFSGTEMYHDDDSQAESYIRKSVEDLKGINPPIEHYFFLYLTLIAPGGSESDSKRRELLGLLEEASPRKYWKRLESIGESIRSFGRSSTVDAGPTIKSILESLGDYEPTWVGSDVDAFPQSGVFIGSPFGEKDIPGLMK